MVSFTPRPLYLTGKSLQYLFDRTLGDPRDGVEAVEKRLILALPEIEPRISSL
jgi:hypothetical protein